MAQDARNLIRLYEAICEELNEPDSESVNRIADLERRLAGGFAEYRHDIRAQDPEDQRFHLRIYESVERITSDPRRKYGHAIDELRAWL